ncbi:hypothetical protein [Priestia megaterium]|uniref:hypothetical protein n=1 Tax=Priestia megaterium TaxID=1404 RepID=UPI00203FA2C0|nr:hypothetical protein [Priestia megaterium]MCM3546883.1 hypothetical protein [Priestia megaterium]
MTTGIIEILIPRPNIALVTKLGNDSTASIGGSPFKTINGAISAINSIGATGITILVYPGIYDETIIMPPGNSLRGVSLLTVIIQKQNVTSNTTLLTMGENTRVEDITLMLTSTNHVNLTGVAFPGTTSQTAKLRTISLTVDNSTASTTGTSNIYGIHSYGTGNLSGNNDAIRASIITVKSAGLGTKRVLLVNTNSHRFNCRDTNFFITSAGGSGSYIGAEINQSGSQLVIRASTIQGITADISQTAGSLTIGTTNLLNSNANNLGFSTVLQPPTIIWADPGSLPKGAVRFYRPGSSSVSTTEIFIRLSQKCLLKSLNVRSLTGPGVSNTDTWTIRRNGIDTPLTVSLTGAQTNNINNNNSVSFQAGDSLSLKVTTSAGTSVTDTVIQVDIF